MTVWKLRVEPSPTAKMPWLLQYLATWLHKSPSAHRGNVPGAVPAGDVHIVKLCSCKDKKLFN